MVMKYKTYISYMLIYLYKKELLAPKEIGTLIKNYAEANDCDIDNAQQQLLNINSILQKSLLFQNIVADFDMMGSDYKC